MEQLLKDIFALGRLPRQRGQTSERHLYVKLWRARVNGKLSSDQEARLSDLGAIDVGVLVQEICALGRIPQRVSGESEAEVSERSLAYRLQFARQLGRLSGAQEARLALVEAMAPPDPMDGFLDDAGNRLEQDLLMVSVGIRNPALAKRLQRYQRFVDDPVLQSRLEVQKYRKALQEACASVAGPASYVAGQDIKVGL